METIAEGHEAADDTSLPLLPVRVGLVDDHPALLLGLTTILKDFGEQYQIVATGATADDAISIAAESKPDVILVDLSMPGDAFAAIQQIATRYPETRVVVFTAYAEVGLARRALDVGSRAFVLKGRPAEELELAISKVCRGETFVSPNLALGVSGGAERQGRSRAALSKRETQLLDCLLEAKSNKEIATQLGLTEKTVKHYMTNLMAKVGAKNRLETVLNARRLGLTSTLTEALGESEYQLG